ncbi:peptidase domain-containing ABC transporter [Niabella yanshanensis]|uniref:Peptidase domain-containing ABC transporter n=1 Tax=Niabella yanshanensis TaxID=577386 RepID=A0ABZ0W7K3_9BACT|nr:peptidase domain-containing ABC transporter [Niabella yanshanensis]WQD38100.1 peptidase domain-containing ABC transporter [Niabella yanshanensis]
MRSTQLKAAQISLVHQQDKTDCGIACLLSLIKYYDGSNTLENLRILSGTNSIGTTLLGLYQAANSIGFTAEGCESDLDSLIKHPNPCILHVTASGNSYHYVVCFGYFPVSNKTTANEATQAFLIGDPAKGVSYYSKEELADIWHTKTCLTLSPNEHFIKTSNKRQAKIRWIKDLIREDTHLLSIGACLGIFVAGLSLAMAIFSQRLIDDILPNKNLVKLLGGIILVFLLLLIKEGLSILRQHFLIRQAKLFNIRIISFFFNHLLSLPKSFFDTHKIGDMTARLNDTSRIQRAISQLAGSVVIDVLAVLISLILVFAYSLPVGFICLLVMPLFYLLIYKNNASIVKRQKNVMVGYAAVEANYISTLQGIETVKNNNSQNLFQEANHNIYKKFQEAVYSLNSIQIKLSAIVSTLGVLFLIGILSYCCYEVLNNQLQIGELIAILSMCGTMLPAVANLAMISIPINEAKIAFDRMFDFASSKSEKAESNELISAFECLSANRLFFRFAGRKPLLKDISFTIRKGEIVALMGENGCGKSTIAELLQKNYTAESGDIFINKSLLLQHIDIAAWRNLVKIVPQDIHIFNATVLENIAFEDATQKTSEVIQFLKQYGFSPYIDAMPQSIMTIVGEGGINLSGGQKQMIAIARALYKKPQLLILDEATAAMDRNSEQFVLALLSKLKKQMGIIFITHRLHVLKSLCDRIYLLENGTITTSGSHSDLIKGHNLYGNYWQDILH